MVTEAALDKLGARAISAEETAQLLLNEHVTVRNPKEGADPGTRRLLIGRTNGGRSVTLVIEQTVDPTRWLIVTGWEATDSERKILSSYLMSEPPGHTSNRSPATLTLATIDPRYVERHRGDPERKVRILLTVEGEDARRLQRIAAARGQ